MSAIAPYAVAQRAQADGATADFYSGQRQPSEGRLLLTASFPDVALLFRRSAPKLASASVGGRRRAKEDF